MTAMLLDLLLQASIRGSLLCLGALLLAMLLRRAAPSVRHLLWLAALAGFLIVPLAFLALPPLTVPVPVSRGASRVAAAIPATSMTQQAVPSISLVGRTPLSQPAAYGSKPAFDWRQLLVLLWAAGALAMAGRSPYALLILRRVSHDAAPLEGPHAAAAALLTERFSPGRPVRILQSKRCGVPMTFGSLRPVVLLPPGLAESSASMLASVLAHEMSHVRRKDALTGQIAYLICCVFWFVPFAWLALFRLKVEQEKACDLAALEATGKGPRYAEMLLRMHASTARSFMLAPFSAQMIGEKAIAERIRNVLNARIRRSRAGKPVILIAAIAGAAAISMTRCSPAPVNKTAAQAEDTKGIQLVWENNVVAVGDATLKTEDYPVLWPVPAGGAITTYFGTATNPFTGKSYLHTGVDIAWSEGTPIVAAANGTVDGTGYSAEEGYFVTISHPSRFATYYSHLGKAILVKKGDSVEAGQQIAYLGNTGQTTGPHVHYEVRQDGAIIDPMTVIAGKLLVPGHYGRSATVALKSGKKLSITGSNITTTDLPLLWPVGQPWARDLSKRTGKIVQPFGDIDKSLDLPGASYLHNGIDISVAPGNPVVATANGTVMDVGTNAGYGTYVVIKHIGEIQTMYAHLETSVLVSKGEIVQQGQQIGYLGRRDSAAGPVLHYAMFVQGNALDPMEMIDAKVSF